MKEDDCSGAIRSAQDKVEFWEKTVQQRRRTAGRVFSTAADNEDLAFAERRLTEARVELDAVKAKITGPREQG